jgi:hypothetical protein
MSLSSVNRRGRCLLNGFQRLEARSVKTLSQMGHRRRLRQNERNLRHAAAFGFVYAAVLAKSRECRVASVMRQDACCAVCSLATTGSAKWLGPNFPVYDDHCDRSATGRARNPEIIGDGLTADARSSGLRPSDLKMSPRRFDNSVSRVSRCL